MGFRVITIRVRGMPTLFLFSRQTVESVEIRGRAITRRNNGEERHYVYGTEVFRTTSAVGR